MNSDKPSSAFHRNDCTPWVGRIAWCARIPQIHHLCHLTWAFLPLPSLIRSSQNPHKYRKVYAKTLGSGLILSLSCSIHGKSDEHHLCPNLKPRGSLNDPGSGMGPQAWGEFTKLNIFQSEDKKTLGFSHGELPRGLQTISEMLSQCWWL